MVVEKIPNFTELNLHLFSREMGRETFRADSAPRLAGI